MSCYLKHKWKERLVSATTFMATDERVCEKCGLIQRKNTLLFNGGSKWRSINKVPKQYRFMMTKGGLFDPMQGIAGLIHILLYLFIFITMSVQVFLLLLLVLMLYSIVFSIVIYYNNTHWSDESI
jgi:hypothetical protein